MSHRSRYAAKEHARKGRIWIKSAVHPFLFNDINTDGGFTMSLDAGQAFHAFIEEVIQKAGPTTAQEVMAVRNQLYSALEQYFVRMLSGMQPESDTDQIAADNVIIELLDARTGQLYRRPVELRYEENDNGIVLTGEDMSGRSASIVFLSDAYLKKLVDISGQGPDENECG